MKIAYFCEPQIGGTFTFFLRLRSAMARTGDEVRCISPVSAEKFKGTRFDGIEGVDYIAFPDDLAAATRILRDRIVADGFDLALNLPGCECLTTNLIRYLPRKIRTMARVPMMTEGAYRPVRATADHLDRVICVCERIRDDLATSVPPRKLAVIHNGCDTSNFSAPLQRTAGPLKLLFSGRLEDAQKNVMMLPRILARVRAAIPEATLTIVGTGPDGDRVRKLARELGVASACHFAHAVPNEQLPALLRAADIFLFPTRFEGSPNALLEAMACGCVPVVSNLRGSTDSIVENARCGFLCRVGHLDDFASHVIELGRDRPRLAVMQTAAAARIREHFTVERMTAAYAAAFRDVLSSPDQRAGMLDPARYEIPRGLRSTWKRFIPRPVKTFVRTQLERIGRSA